MHRLSLILSLFFCEANRVHLKSKNGILHKTDTYGRIVSSTKNKFVFKNTLESWCFFMSDFDNIFNTLKCDEKHLVTLRKLTNFNLVKGNLLSDESVNCIIFIDKSPFFHIKKSLYDEKMLFLSKICHECHIYPYMTYLYKTNKFSDIDISDCIMSLYYEIDYIINGIYFNCPNVILVHFGNSEISSVIMSSKIDKNIHNIYVSSIYNYHLLDVDKYINNFVTKIKSVLDNIEDDH